MRILQRSFLFLALALLIFVPRNIFSCGPFIETATFSFVTHPDYPMKDYLAGKLGIIKPSFYRVFLVVAYRNLSGPRFSAKEQAALEPLLTSEAHSADAMESYGIEDIGDRNPPSPPPSGLWLIERAKVLGEPPPKDDSIDPNLNWGNYQSFLNCPDAAFTNAVATLRDRQQKWSANSAELKTWIAGQDIVFGRCSKRQEALPAAVSTDNKLLQQDREYQIAAALFYSGVPAQLEQASLRFEAIAQDQSSPWHTWAPYLTARTLIRQATLKSADDRQFDPALMTQAESALTKILADKESGSTHRASERLLGFVEARLHPEQRIREVSQRLMSGASTDITQDLIDFRYLLDHDIAVKPDSDSRKDDLTDWVRTFQGEAPKGYALHKWKETKSLQWLVAAMNASGPKDADLKDLVDAAAKLDAHDPRMLTLLYDRIVLLRGAGKDTDARALIDANLSYLAKNPPVSARNLFWRDRLAMAQTYDEFLHFAPRRNAELDREPGTQALTQKVPVDLYFDSDATAVLNRALPLPLLEKAAVSSRLSKPLQAQIAQATWTRALLLEKPDVAARLAPTVKQDTPVLAPFVDDVTKAGTAEERHRAVLFTLLHNPGLRPHLVPNVQRTTGMQSFDSFHDNWWCADMGQRDEEHPDHAVQNVPTAFLSPADTSAGAADWNALLKLGTAPNYLASEVIAWAKATPDDPRVPEALHFVVRATHLGCTDDKTSSYSKQTFRLLHSKYPQSAWTKKTRYYY
jgi:hypothetical protein